MKTPDVVAACVEAMRAAVSIPVTVKCRIGVDEQDPEPALDAVADHVFAAGADGLWVHARKAWLQGLSPKENREIPPLDYDRVRRLKERSPARFIGINGGIHSLDEAEPLLESTDGVMLGRVAYQTPGVLAEVDSRFYGAEPRPVDYDAIFTAMADYADRHIAVGGRLSHLARHMVGLFHGLPGARRYRQILSTEANKLDAGSGVLWDALREVDRSASAEAVAA
jgi:tRNA-dihydrouridine synthase A